MKNNIKSIILRFRDLLIPDTIMEHKKIIDKNGEVLWGWWSKPQETIPFCEFNDLNQLIKSEGSLRIYLFDSGNKKLYSALCKEIHYDKEAKPIVSPNQKRTPEYYRKSLYKAWFCLSEISDVFTNKDADKALKKLAYVEVNDFFVSQQSPFNEFNNKIVFGCNELFLQQRTIWFVKDKLSNSKKWEIHSYSNSLVEGSNVDSQYKPLQSNSVLWLSDLHFSNNHHTFKKTPGNTITLSNSLAKSLTENKVQELAAAIISGDITYQAISEEFDSALSFIRDIESGFGIEPKTMTICPGNHDIAFSSKPYKDDEPISVVYEEAKEEYVNFYKKATGYEPNDMLFTLRRYLTKDLIPVEIIGLNTCLLQQEKGVFQGMGYAGNDQLNEIAAILSNNNESVPFRILVMHHHLVPVIFRETPYRNPAYSITLDSEAISKFVIENKIRLVLHGHAHKEFFMQIGRKSGLDLCTYNIIGLGSAGSDDLADQSNNMYAIIELNKEEIIIKGHELKSNGANGQVIFTHTINY